MKYRFQGTIKAITFKDARVSVLLENTTFMSNEGDWKQWVDWKLIEGGKYKKGDVWVSAFEQSAPQVFQACKMIEKGSEVEVEIFKTDKGFLNINNIQLKVEERDVNADLQPPSEEDEKRMAEEPQPPKMVVKEDIKEENFPQPEWGTEEPSSDQRPEDSPEAQAEKMADDMGKLSPEQEQQMMMAEPRVKEMSTTVDTREYRIVFQACLKGLGASNLARSFDELIEMTERATQRVFRGK